MTSQMQKKGEPVRLVAINAGVSDPSSTRMLVDRIARNSFDQLFAAGRSPSLLIIDLGPMAVDIAKALTGGFPNEKVRDAINALARADAIIAATPVYKAGLSGLFKSFIDIIDEDLLNAKPVALAATAGTSRHTMVIDHQMRPLFAFLRATPVPTSIFATPDDLDSPQLSTRIDRAAAELTQLVLSGVGRAAADSSRQATDTNLLAAEHLADDVY